MWSGSIINKSIGTVRFVPLEDMTLDDWEWLDYENIRDVAKDRIASLIFAGELIGFFAITLTEKFLIPGRAKLKYFWPATKAMHKDFQDNETPNFFRNHQEDETPSDDASKLDDLVTGLGALPVETIILLLSYVDDDNARKLSKGIGEKPEPFILFAVTLLLTTFTPAELGEILDEAIGADEADIKRFVSRYIE